jgi:hypothetical protein
MCGLESHAPLTTAEMTAACPFRLYYSIVSGSVYDELEITALFVIILSAKESNEIYDRWKVKNVLWIRKKRVV